LGGSVEGHLLVQRKVVPSSSAQACSGKLRHGEHGLHRGAGAGLGCRQGLGCRIYGQGFRIYGQSFRIYGQGFRIYGQGFRV